jgi:hypothetical protein
MGRFLADALSHKKIDNHYGQSRNQHCQPSVVAGEFGLRTLPRLTPVTIGIIRFWRL